MAKISGVRAQISAGGQRIIKVTGSVAWSKTPNLQSVRGRSVSLPGVCAPSNPANERMLAFAEIQPARLLEIAAVRNWKTRRCPPRRGQGLGRNVAALYHLPWLHR